MHAQIRCFEFLLHISYRLEIKKWLIRGNDDKEVCGKKKRIIQNKFIEELGLRVDFPRQGGSGTSNDGNAARREFKHFDLFSSITDIDKELIERLANILNIQVYAPQKLLHPKNHTVTYWNVASPIYT